MPTILAGDVVSFIQPDDSRAAATGDRVISGSDDRALTALEWFLHIYGAFAGSMALRCLPSGGIYITAGIAGKIAGQFNDGAFMDSFNANPRLHSLLKEFPVQIVLNPEVSLYGAELLAKVDVTLANPYRDYL